MKRTSLVLRLALLVTVGLASAYLLSAQPVVAGDGPRPLGPVGVWHRLNPDPNNPTPEHEVLRCGGHALWHCMYDKHPEPQLDFEHPPDGTFGQFWGENITSDWNCPTWFGDKCDETVFVAGGVMRFQYPDGSYLDVNQDLVLIDQTGEPILWAFWVDSSFACPWYTSFDRALTASEFPLPFNGVDWPAMDCVFPQ